MGTQLILTVGTNALPVWVAWYHLKDILEPPITVRFVYTSDTETQKNSLVSYCAGAGSGRHIQTSPGALGTVRGDIRREILTDLKDYLHVHYTGGTKVMSVETISTIESGLPEDILMDTTYLDPRGKIGPRITSRSKVLVEDARLGIKPSLRRIADLNGFELLSSNSPTEVESTAGQAYLRSPSQIYLEDSHTDTIDGTRIVRGKAYDFGDLLEYGAYAAFKKALEKICAEAARSGRKRDNYKLFHDVKAKRIEATTDGEDFQLDVVAILGYQIVVVSCSISKTNKEIKLKAMEAYHRARQLGGDEARVVTLSGAPAAVADDVERKLMVDIGGQHPPLQVWGMSEWADLPAKFEDYLRKQMLWD